MGFQTRWMIRVLGFRIKGRVADIKLGFIRNHHTLVLGLDIDVFLNLNYRF